MRTSRYTETQIIAILHQAEGGVPVTELCREHRMSNASFYKWRAKYGNMDASMISRMNGEIQDRRPLKKMFAKLSMQNELLKEALGKSNGPSQRRGMAETAVERRGVSITLACPTFGVSETCYR